MFDERKRFGVWLAAGLLIGMGLAVLSGCGQQLDVSAGVGWKSLYPDRVGEAELTDPRKGMYDGSGYGERHTAGSESGVGFSGMRGGEK